ncbi:hypothetical protein POI8812_01284 [Pontivivens insulae]|uniref:Uncharacterized protein n=1 Tax=Pontivivens insulae TaxID=1639689 RepID=A0A2R8A9S9_9RHOB|nr:hypothetical protein POI8812_01284 [Pontivivens insulae]
MALVKARTFGVIQDTTTNTYVRWMRDGSRQVPFLAVQDCFRFIGIQRTDAPNGPRIRARVRGAETCLFLRKNYRKGGKQVILGIPATNVLHIDAAFPIERKNELQRELIRLCLFLIEHGPNVLLEPYFISSEKFERPR